MEWKTYTRFRYIHLYTVNAAGCDSTATLNLTISNSTTSQRQLTSVIRIHGMEHHIRLPEHIPIQHSMQLVVTQQQP